MHVVFLKAYRKIDFLKRDIFYELSQGNVYKFEKQEE